MPVTEARVGDVLVNNDPRKKGETITVVAVFDKKKKVKYQGKSRFATIAFHRIFDDNAVRAVGYNRTIRGYAAPANDEA